MSTDSAAVTAQPKSLNALVQSLQAPLHTNVLLVAGDVPDHVTVQHIQLAHDVAEVFAAVAQSCVTQDLQHPVLREYGPAYQPGPQELCFLRLDDSPSVASIVAAVSNVATADLFQEDKRFIDKLKCYAIVTDFGGDDRAIFFRSFSPTRELGRRRGFALWLQDGQYNKVNEKVFLFDDTVDCYAWDGRLFIRSISKFHQIFRYLEALRAVATETIQAVLERVPVSNADELLVACTSDLHMMAKVAGISRQPYLARVTMADIKRTIEKFSLDVQTTTEDGEEKLVFERSLAKRWQILKLLDDDYLGSVMTDELYEVNSKTRRAATN